MAKAKAAPAAAKGGGTKKKGKMGLYTAMIVAGFAAPFMFPTVVLLLVGLIPTLVAFFVDKDRQHSAATAIGAMNFAGLVPFIIDLWVRGQSMGTVFEIFSQSSTWLIVLGSAAVGQLIVSVIPQALATLTLAHSESRIKTLKGNLDLLRESWGAEVGTTKSIEKIINRE